MAQNLKVSQPYANAFIQMISGKDSLDKVISDLTYIEAALKSPDLVQAFSNPLLGEQRGPADGAGREAEAKRHDALGADSAAAWLRGGTLPGRARGDEAARAGGAAARLARVGEARARERCTPRRARAKPGNANL